MIRGQSGGSGSPGKPQWLLLQNTKGEKRKWEKRRNIYEKIMGGNNLLVQPKKKKKGRGLDRFSDSFYDSLKNSEYAEGYIFKAIYTHLYFPKE